MKTLMRSLAVLLAAAAETGAASTSIHSGVTAVSGGSTTGNSAPAVPAGSPASPGAANGKVGSPAVTGAATPLNPNSPPPGAAVNQTPAQTPPPVSGAAMPLNPNAPVPGAPSGQPSNATLGIQATAAPLPVAGQVPTDTIAAAITNPAAATGAATSGQNVQGAVVQSPPSNFGQQAQPGAAPAPNQAVPPGAAPPIAVQNLEVTRQNGTLVLTGTVRSQADKDAAGQRAATASGGEAVVNDLVVQ
ncbi:MAG TPA: BON domain-containing protein [Elusimicrobiota bacterium]|nr:BON domain-containing protein [Elusimicrobiota bacterium]